jgi:predicted metal-dependent HD superfamily phosphohydrolase
MLQKKFRSLIKKYAAYPPQPENFWNEIQFHYCEKWRHYHTLTHLQNLLDVLTEAQTQVEEWDVTLFAVFYHDIIYIPTNNNNEEKSAELAKERLSEISFPAKKINHCCSMILATKTHTVSADSDTNYFTDADLSILGQRNDVYIEYTKQVRQEYSIFPDFLYKPGRRKALERFLKMDQIFKTEYFFKKLEKQARENLRFELQTL